MSRDLTGRKGSTAEDTVVTGYEKIKAIAKQGGVNIPDLLVLAPQNDPFYAGSRSAIEKAEWFAALWSRFGFPRGVHLRRAHYILVSAKDPVILPNGKPYENTEDSWAYLGLASKYARYLRLVDPAAFVDRRNGEPRLFVQAYQAEPLYVATQFEPWEMPTIAADLLGAGGEWNLPALYPAGYNYHPEMQPFHVELWNEKSTMDDILIPLCERYRVNYITGVGFLSVTSVIRLLQRNASIGKPCRILYVSDYDPAGIAMPVSIARQIEFWIQEYGMDAAIKLNPIILTADQVEEYDLPRIPIKETDKRRQNFEDRHGAGATELDALEALYPGVFRRIVTEHILEFIDEDLKDRIEDTEEEAQEILNDYQESRIEHYRPQFEELKGRVSQITAGFSERLQDLRDQLAEELRPHAEALNSLRLAVQSEIEQIQAEVSLPELPKPDVYPDDDEWLFDSSRSYEEQLEAYRAHKNGQNGKHEREM